MLEEAKAAESRRDFISKCSIGLKEAREVHIRLRIQEATKVGDTAEARSMREEAGEIMAIIGTIVRNAKANLKKAKLKQDAEGTMPKTTR